MEIKVEPKLYGQFLSEIAVHFSLSPTTRKILEEFVNVDVNAEAVAKVIQANQYLESLLYQQVKSLGLKEENRPSLQAVIALMGMQTVRNFSIAMQLFRVITRKQPEIGKDGKFSLKPSDYLKYALKAEEFASGRKLLGAESAFGAGMMFDILRILAKEKLNAAKGFDEYVEDVYKHSLKTAFVGVSIVKNYKNFVYAKHVFSACLLHDIGKLVMDLLFPQGVKRSYQSFIADAFKKPLTRDAIYFAEQMNFGITHEYFSAQLCAVFPMFRVFERAILFHHNPYVLKSVNKDMFTFAAILALSTNMATNYRTPKDTNDPIFDSWITPELQNFGADRKQLLEMMRKIGNTSF